METNRVSWLEITGVEYHGVYGLLRSRLVTFGVYTADDEAVTEWGLRDSDAPLIKSHCRGEDHRYTEVRYWAALVNLTESP